LVQVERVVLSTQLAQMALIQFLPQLHQSALEQVVDLVLQLLNTQAQMVDRVAAGEMRVLE
jgi:hypothetical protein